MNPVTVAHICAELTLLRYFPADENGRAALVALVGRMCSNEDQVRWLVQRTLALCNEWPGPLVFRQILCSRFKPADGFNAGSTDAFPDGVPSEKQIEAPALLALPPGHLATVDPGYDRSIRLLAAAKDMNRRQAPVVQGPPTNPNFKPITQADIDRFVRHALYENIVGCPAQAQSNTRMPEDVVTIDMVPLLSVAKDMDRLRRRVPSGERPDPDYKPITQADIDKAVQENRDKRARAELYGNQEI